MATKFDSLEAAQKYEDQVQAQLDAISLAAETDQNNRALRWDFAFLMQELTDHLHATYGV